MPRRLRYHVRPPIRMSDATLSAILDQPIFIGSTAASEPSVLRGHGISHVVAVSLELPSHLGQEFSCLHLPVADDIYAPIHHHLEPAASFIHSAIVGGGKVCVCCVVGASCSPTVVIYYLMRHALLSLAAALDLVTASHPPTQPNIGFVQRLTEAEAWMSGCVTPTLSVEEYKWRFLQRLFPEADRTRILDALQAGRHEVAQILQQ